MADKPNATAFIEDVLLPYLGAEIEREKGDLGTASNKSVMAGALALKTIQIKQFIQSRRSEWAQE